MRSGRDDAPRVVLVRDQVQHRDQHGRDRWLKFSVSPARDKIVPTSRRSASMNMVGPATLVSRARACASTIGSLST